MREREREASLYKTKENGRRRITCMAHAHIDKRKIFWLDFILILDMRFGNIKRQNIIKINKYITSEIVCNLIKTFLCYLFLYVKIIIKT